jgi:hypothetical protein
MKYNIKILPQIKQWQVWRLDWTLIMGDKFDYDNTRLGRVISLGPRITMQIGKHFQASVRHILSGNGF